MASVSPDYELGMQTVISRAAYDPETDKELTKAGPRRSGGRLEQAPQPFVPEIGVLDVDQREIPLTLVTKRLQV
jgi:hypothetical protein